GDARRARLRDQGRQHALHEHRQRDEGESRADGDRCDRLHADRARVPRTSVRTTSDIPISIVIPVTVRTHQNGRTALTEPIQSAWAISMNPCWSPCAVSTSVIATIPVVISQNPALAIRKLDGAARVTRGQT